MTSIATLPGIRLATAAALLVASGVASAQTPFTYITNWYAQAEHGGYYQAVAQGLYRSTAWT
jgi:NitT/TauT family transport system substrate-binding protein